MAKSSGNGSGCFIAFEVLSSIVLVVWMIIEKNTESAVWIVVLLPFSIWLIGKMFK